MFDRIKIELFLDNIIVKNIKKTKVKKCKKTYKNVIKRLRP